ncbi:MAG: chromate efflux transporter [Chloroflexi bacterium]|nr:MAG: chromate efflux transporter [Chloroflexota bacterium]
MKSNHQPSIAELFISFLRLGLTAFGGPSMIAYIRTMAVEKKGWLDAETFSNGVVLCQTIPGATAMQAAAYVGLKTRGVIGAGASFLGFGLPAFLLMMTFSALYTNAHNLPIVLSAFSGLQAIIVATIANATLSFGKTTLKDWKTFAIAGIAAALFGLNANPILVILLAAILGLALIKPRQLNSSHPISSDQTLPTAKPLLRIVIVSAIGFLLIFIFNRTLFELATLMFRIDLFAFGGGFASVPLMLHEIVEVRHWMDSQTFMNGIVLGQVTPGPIVITATFVGFLLGGPLGGLIATISIFLPSFLILVGISPYFDRLRLSPYFHKVIGGVLCSFVGLLLTVTIRFALNVHWDLSHLLLASGALVALLLKVDILWVVLVGMIISVVIII